MEHTTVNQDTDVLFVECEHDYLHKMHMMIEEYHSNHYDSNSCKNFTDAIEAVAKQYGATAYSKEGSTWYLFRFPSKNAKLQFLLKTM